jgi:hypothetical protein
MVRLPTSPAEGFLMIAASRLRRQVGSLLVPALALTLTTLALGTSRAASVEQPSSFKETATILGDSR